MDKSEKALKRLLKELGIYQAYINDRLKQYCPPTEMWGLKCECLPDIIDRSFIWARTRHEALWENLHDQSKFWRPEEIIRDKAEIERLKDVCKRYA